MVISDTPLVRKTLENTEKVTTQGTNKNETKTKQKHSTMRNENPYK